MGEDELLELRVFLTNDALGLIPSGQRVALSVAPPPEARSSALVPPCLLTSPCSSQPTSSGAPGYALDEG